jgi:hypothetical protein
MSLSLTTYSITTLSIMTYSITTLSIKGLFVTLSLNVIQQKNAQHNKIATIPSVLCWVSQFTYCYADCHYAECRYAECHGADWSVNKLFFWVHIRPGIQKWHKLYQSSPPTSVALRTKEDLQSGVNFTNILWAAFAPKSFCRKIINPNCKHIKAAQKTYVWKSCS